MTRILIDSDVGTNPDDALAIYLAARSPGIELVGVAAAGQRPELRVRIASELLSECKTGQILFAAGDGQSIRGIPFSRWGGYEGVGILDEAARNDPGCFPPAERLFQNWLGGQALPVTILCIGPLTNLARLISSNPEAANQAERVVIMGGCFERPKLGTRYLPLHSEGNLSADREAAWVVFESNLPITLVPAELTYQVSLSRAEAQKLASLPGRAGKYLAAHLQHYRKYMVECFGKERGVPAEELQSVGCFLHDVVALAALVRPALFQFDTVRTQIEETQEHIRLREVEEGRPMKVAREMDQEKFMSWFWKTLELA